MTPATHAVVGGRQGWRTPAVIVVCGCLIAVLTFGVRASFGLFTAPISATQGWGREVFALAGADPRRVRPVTTAQMPRLAHRPDYSALSMLSTARAGLTPLRPWREALAASLKEHPLKEHPLKEHPLKEHPLKEHPLKERPL